MDRRATDTLAWRTIPGARLSPVPLQACGVRPKKQVLLGPNELAKGLKFLSLGAFQVSDDANLLAYTTDTTGFRQYRLSVKDLRTGATLPDAAERVGSVEWCADNRTLYYTTEDPVTKRSNMAWRHPLGDETEPVYQEKDRLYNVRLGRSKDRKMLLLRSTSTDTWETRYLPSDQPGGTFQVVLPREKGHKYDVEHRDGLFYIRTNRDAKNFRLVTAPVSDPSPKGWKELLPHRADVLLDRVEVFKDYLVASEKGRNRLSATVSGRRTSHRRRIRGECSGTPFRAVCATHGTLATGRCSTPYASPLLPAPLRRLVHSRTLQPIFDRVATRPLSHPAGDRVARPQVLVVAHPRPALPQVAADAPAIASSPPRAPELQLPGAIRDARPPTGRHAGARCPHPCSPRQVAFQAWACRGALRSALATAPDARVDRRQSAILR